MDFVETIHHIYLNSGHLAVICLSINVLLCLFKFKKLDLPFQRLCYFLIFNILTEIVARSLAYSDINNLPLLHLYTLGEFILLLWFFKSLIIKPAFFQSKFNYLLIGGAILIILNSLFIQSIYAFNPLAKTFVQLVIISLAVLYFYHLNENQSLPPIIEKSLRLINSAILIYYSGSLFIFMCSQIFIDNSDLYKTFWAFNAVLNFIFQLLILWGIWKVIFRKAPLSS